MELRKATKDEDASDILKENHKKLETSCKHSNSSEEIFERKNGERN